MNNKLFYLIFIFSSFFLNPKANARPNIILIMVDDMGCLISDHMAAW